MSINSTIAMRMTLLISILITVTLLSDRLRADTGTCGGVSITLPFMDVPNTNIFFCSIAEAFFSGLSNGTSPSTYSPSDNVPREQMAAFVTRTLDQSLKRGSRRAALNQYWTPTSADDLTLTSVVSGTPRQIRSDGTDLWAATYIGNTVVRVRTGDGKLMETWTGATSSWGVVAAKGLVFVTGFTSPGKLYQIDPTQPVGAVTTLANTLGAGPQGIAFDGKRIWTANMGGSVSIVTPNPVGVTTVTTGLNQPEGILYDGTNIWVTDVGTTPGRLLKLDSNGAVLQHLQVGNSPQFPIFDGINIWVPNNGSNTVSVIRASTGAILATLSGNGLNLPSSAAFDGERVLVTNTGGDSVSLWKATDLSPLGSVGTGSSSGPNEACSDGLNFWISLFNVGQLARF